MSPRCYTVRQIRDALQISRTSFKALKKQGRLPFLEELLPRIGARARYRAEPVDRYLAGQWGGPKAFRRTA